MLGVGTNHELLCNGEKTMQPGIKMFGFISMVLACSATARAQVVINEFNPRSGAEGDLITIRGSGFDPNPDNNCAVVMMTETCSLPLQVVEVTPDGTEMQVVVGPVFQGAQPGPIMVALGNGAFGTFDPVFPEIELLEDVWVWNRIPNGPAGDTIGLGANGIFTPIRPPEEQWIHGEPNATGTICLTLDGDWCPQQELSMVVRLHDHLQGIGHDAFFPHMGLRGPAGSAVECAAAICDMIVCAFFQQSGILIDCQVTDLGNNQAKLTIGINGGFVDWGNLDICLIRCDEEPPVVGCVETVNPHGRTVPPAGSTTLPGPRGGQNEDGFYELQAEDNFDAPEDIAIFVVDTGSNTIFGPLRTGDRIKYTEAPGGRPVSKKIGSTSGQAGAITVHITGNGDAAIFGVDTGGNISDLVFCLVPPPPK
jgi:hypothetical protein